MSGLDYWRAVLSQKERDANLLVVAAVQGYSLKHNVSAAKTAELFSRKGLFDIIRSSYEVLHTQSLEESASFAEDVLARMGT